MSHKSQKNPNHSYKDVIKVAEWGLKSEVELWRWTDDTIKWTGQEICQKRRMRNKTRARVSNKGRTADKEDSDNGWKDAEVTIRCQDQRSELQSRMIGLTKVTSGSDFSVTQPVLLIPLWHVTVTNRLWSSLVFQIKRQAHVKHHLLDDHCS